MEVMKRWLQRPLQALLWRQHSLSLVLGRNHSVPGIHRVRVQSDPAGRLVVTGEPENVDNPWGVTPFKKVVNLPSRIDSHQTSAVVTLHGQLFVRVPFEQSD